MAASVLWLLRGVLLGLSVAAPVGPIGALCIRRTLMYGWASGFISGLGAATADMCYGSVAAFGLVAVSTVLVSQQVLIRGVGGVVLLSIGIRSMLAGRPATNSTPAQRMKLWAAYASTVALTLTNPLTMLSFTAMFAAAGLGSGGGSRAAGVLVAGVFLGSALWWLALSAGVALAPERLGPRLLGSVHRLSGAVLAGFGLVALGSLVVGIVGSLAPYL